LVVVLSNAKDLVLVVLSNAKDLVLVVLSNAIAEHPRRGRTWV
jgi:hypothetical protein